MRPCFKKSVFSPQVMHVFLYTKYLRLLFVMHSVRVLLI